MDRQNWPPDNPCIRYRVTDLGNDVLRIESAELIDAPGKVDSAALLTCCPCLSDALLFLGLEDRGVWVGYVDDRGDNWMQVTSWKV